MINSCLRLLEPTQSVVFSHNTTPPKPHYYYINNLASVKVPGGQREATTGFELDDGSKTLKNGGCLRKGRETFILPNHLLELTHQLLNQPFLFHKFV